MASDDLARRLVTHPRWKWMPGMLLAFWYPEKGAVGVCRYLVVDVDNDGLGCIKDDGSKSWGLCMDGRDPIDSDDNPTPILSDPATQGCLRAMLCTAAGGISVETISPGAGVSEGWCIRIVEDGEPLVLYTDTLGEALALALLACWGEG